MLNLKTPLAALATLATVCFAIAPAGAEGIDDAKLKAVIEAAWPNLSPELQARVDQDETQAACTKYRNDPPPEVADAIIEREKKNVVYPADGVLMGDWKVALKEANNGFGWRMRDDPVKRRRAIGGNCYACHQLTEEEVAYGNLGPSLLGYGKDREIDAETIKATYDKIYSPHIVFPCSNMPRLGATGFLTPEQIRDYVAMLLDPKSPVNK